jgi:hypothetical protein
LIDQGDRWSHLCVLDVRGEVLKRERVQTTRKAYEKWFGGERVKGRVVLEIGPPKWRS